MPRARPALLLAAVWLSACSVSDFDLPGPRGADGYADQYPFYAEFCALSQIKKKPGFGANIRGEIGGHAVFYLNGACLLAGAGYPVLQVCDGQPADGVGLSMNSHFRNAKWAATPGRRFFYEGAQPAANGLTRAGYERTQAEAKRLGIYDGITFHEEVFADMPPGWSREDWKYEVSAATDYGIGMGRGRYCARVPVTRAQMSRMVLFLNDQNAPYRAGAEFRWSVFRDNCIHLAHNALAVAGLWTEWPINRPLLLAMLNFPVPRNEFVNLVRRTNDAMLTDPAAAYHEPVARRALLEFGRLHTRPGALAASYPPQRPNAVYETDLKLIFYDEPVFGDYQASFDRIFSTSRYFDRDANTAYFVAAYDRMLAARQPLAWWLGAGGFEHSIGFADVYKQFYAMVERERAAILRQADTE